MLKQDVAESVGYLRSRMPESTFAPAVGLILGSGLGAIADRVEDAVVVPFGDVPHMQVPRSSGHAGCFVIGRLEGHDVICMRGRLHAYEGNTALQAAYPVFVLAALGVKTLVETNATGGINESFEVGDLVLVSDHMNFTGQNPLIGLTGDDIDTPFNDMTYAYTPALRTKMHEAAQAQDITLRDGVYLGDLGPSFETPAEIRAFRTLGADVVGMSTVFEVIAAANQGLELVVVSLVTNMAAGVLDQPITAEEVGIIGERRAGDMCRLLQEFLRRL